METTISHILDGRYPYTTFLDEKGDTTSNLPSLFYLGLPFYFIGDVGYLQVLVFGIIFYCLWKGEFSNHKKLFLLSLLLLSPAYLWEIFVKSDLMSNVFLLLFFMIRWGKKNQDSYFKTPILLSCFIAFFLLTRLIVVIPLIVMFFYPFVVISLRNKLVFFSFLILFLVLFITPFIISIPDVETFLQFNPLNNQTGEAPSYLSVLFLLKSFLLSKRFHSINKVVSLSLLLVFSVTLLRFVINVVEEGFKNNVYGSMFDISYFGMTLPFIFFFYYLSDKKFTMHA